MTALFKKHWQTLLNLGLFIAFGAVVTRETYRTWQAGRLDYVEIAFAVQNVIMVSLLLIRRHHRAVERSVLSQAVAVAAFCSGALFMGQPATGGALALEISKGVIFAANVLGIVTLVNLGRSFGILIAFREIKTRGLYGFVRHPMYGTDILLRIGFLISHLSWVTASVFVLSTGCYVLRAVLEERFLRRQPEYTEYMGRVRYRFIPFLF